MTKYIIALAVILTLSPAAFCQSAQIYGFFAPGQIRVSGYSPFDQDSAFALQAGGGAKYIMKNGLGFGAETGIAGPKEGWSNYNFGFFSANGYYVFNKGNKLEPFVTGGYTRTYGWDAVNRNGFNFGGGATYWLAKRAGLLFEFRDQMVRPQGTTVQLLSARFGVAFRLSGGN